MDFVLRKVKGQCCFRRHVDTSIGKVQAQVHLVPRIHVKKKAGHCDAHL